MRRYDGRAAGWCAATMPRTSGIGDSDDRRRQDGRRPTVNLVRVRRGRRTLRRGALLLAGVTVPLGWLLTAPAQGAPPAAASRTVTVTVADTAEAWYAASP